jgi:hypothetical protein
VSPFSFGSSLNWSISAGSGLLIPYLQRLHGLQIEMFCPGKFQLVLF